MNDNKKRLLHLTFSIAERLKKQVYMPQKDFDKFYKASEYSHNKGNGADYTRALYQPDYDIAKAKGAIFLDYNSAYGGYVLQYFTGDHGGVDWGLWSGRYKCSTYCDVLSAFLSGLNYQNKKKTL